ncbi:calcium/sodium antiporter [Aquisalinus flavus]|uniref:Sodium:calcium antiporter n=1 Tax=Aquisalinus flavus TaxID=1526572 RepID=A0A8J2V794_9PROT|nr:calcium/sodium antiporter [Aquisalinus flavus]MBD0425410.1 calcium/sodium antiporter [Aquisalinus flavus]UNE48947.1 calcium/sodium antiporter [Aquisalinus flavus]GGD16280.1 sodium:calcium antiporter [Aquisalinus flavus]
MSFFLIAVGLVLLIFGGDALVRGAVAIAKRAGMSPMLIGLTLVGFGTSLPELLTSLNAAFAGSPGIAIGNVVGSNIANVLLILGCAALIFPLATDLRALKRDGSVMIIATLVVLALFFTGEIGRLAGLVLVVGLFAFMFLAWKTDETAAALEEEIPAAPESYLKAGLFFLAGLIAILTGANMLVRGAITIAADLGVDETVIGLTIVAVGTSLPELVTSVTAALKKQSDIAIGNVIGSNIFNLLAIFGITALIHPLEVPPMILEADGWIMLAAALALIFFAWTGRRIERWEGAVFVLGYVAFTGFLFLR